MFSGVVKDSDEIHLAARICLFREQTLLLQDLTDLDLGKMADTLRTISVDMYVFESFLYIDPNSLRFVHRFPVDYARGLVQILAWRHEGYKPLRGPIRKSQRCVVGIWNHK